MATRVQRSVREIVLLSGLVCSVLPPSFVRAGECGDSFGPGSCYTLEPSLQLVTQGTVTIPADHPIPYHWREATKDIPPPAAQPEEYVTKPGLHLSLAAGVFGEGSGEPMVLIRTNFNYTTDTSVEYLFPTNGNNGIWYKFDCEEGTPLCYVDDSGDRDVWTKTSAVLRRAYRLTKINPGTLPKNVTHAPIMVDYKMAHVIEGTYPYDGKRVPVMRSKTTAAFGYWTLNKSGSYKFNNELVQGFSGLDTVVCWGADGNFVEPTGRTCAGTFTSQVAIDYGDKLSLLLTAENFIETAPGCHDVDTPDGPACLVTPFGGSGHAITDPYVYIDPSWTYASWFKLEVSVDETDTVWVTPERTALDPETLTLLSDGGVPSGDAGSGDGDGNVGDSGAAAGKGDAGAGGGGDNGGGPGGDGASSTPDGGTASGSPKGGDGGCQLGAGNSTFSLWFGASLLAAAIMRRRRGGRRRSI